MTVSMPSIIMIAMTISRVTLAMMTMTTIAASMFIASRTFQYKGMYNGGPKDNNKSLCGSVLKAKNSHAFRPEVGQILLTVHLSFQ